MSTTSTTSQLGDLLRDRLKQTNISINRAGGLADIRAIGATDLSKGLDKPAIIVRPEVSSWEELSIELDKVINYPGLWITVRELYEQGYGAELATAVEIALNIYKKNPVNLFAAMVSKKSGNWANKTLNMIKETWKVRYNALQVIERLNIPADSTKAILALSWRLRGTIIRFLSMATEQGTNVRNPIGLFFALTKKPQLA